MKVRWWTVVAAVWLAGGASAMAQGLDGLRCSGDLCVSRSDNSLSVVCSGDVVVSGGWTLPGMHLSFTAAGQLFNNGSIDATRQTLKAGGFEEGRAAGSLGVHSGAVIRQGDAWMPASERESVGGDVVVSGTGGIHLSAGLKPGAILTVSSVPEPQTYALWLAGLAAVARIAAARRRHRC